MELGLQQRTLRAKQRADAAIKQREKHIYLGAGKKSKLQERAWYSLIEPGVPIPHFMWFHGRCAKHRVSMFDRL
jgi:hypothetical protein